MKKLLWYIAHHIIQMCPIMATPIPASVLIILLCEFTAGNI